jgi:hypothetical protein
LTEPTDFKTRFEENRVGQFLRNEERIQMTKPTKRFFTLMFFLIVMASGSANAASGSTLASESAADAADASIEASDNRVSQPQSLTPGPVPDELVVSDGGIDWVWASPCNGGCGQPDPNNVTGWRFASDAELQLFPGCDAFKADDGSTLCATPYFDPNHSHCDLNDCNSGALASSPFQTALNGNVNGNHESFFIRGSMPETDPVPTLSQWSIILLAGAVLLLSLLRLRQKRLD